MKYLQEFLICEVFASITSLTPWSFSPRPLPSLMQISPSTPRSSGHMPGLSSAVSIAGSSSSSMTCVWSQFHVQWCCFHFCTACHLWWPISSFSYAVFVKHEFFIKTQRQRRHTLCSLHDPSNMCSVQLQTLTKVMWLVTDHDTHVFCM